MARVNLVCSCGWNFIVAPGTQTHQVACPSCGNPVPLPGRKPAGAGLPPKEAARTLLHYHRLKMLATAAAAAAVLIVGLMLLWSGGDRNESEAPMREAPPKLAGPEAGGTTPDETPPAPPLPPPAPSKETVPPPPPKPPPPDPAVCQREIEELIPLVNMAGIVSEALRFAGMQEASSKMLDRMQEYEDRIQENMRTLTELGKQFMLPAHMLPGDQLTWFSGTNLEKQPAAESAVFLSGWLRRYQAGAMERSDIRRGEEEDISLLMYFPMRTKELQSLAEVAKNIKPVEPPPPPPPPLEASTVVDFPADLAQRIRDRFAALPNGYRMRMPPEDLARMDGVLKGGTAKIFMTEVEFLEKCIAGRTLPLFEAEAVKFKEKAAELKPRAMEPFVTDVFHFKDGRKMEGQVESETNETVKIKLKFGSVAIPRSDITQIDRGMGTTREFPDRLKKAEGNALALLDLLTWCKDKKMDLQKEYVCYTLLLTDASNEAARTELKLPK